jgi:hypothetical protein
VAGAVEMHMRQVYRKAMLYYCRPTAEQRGRNFEYEEGLWLGLRLNRAVLRVELG